MAYFDVFDKVRVLIFAYQNGLRSMFLEFLYIVGTPDKRIPEGLFWRFSTNLAF